MALVPQMATLLLALGQAAVPAHATFVDQHGHPHEWSARDERPAVVLVVSARRLRKIKKWEVALRERHADLRYLRVADVAERAEALSHEDVASRLRGRVPEDLPVWIDLERTWARALELDTSQPNLLLLDSGGRIRATHRGNYAAEPLERFCRAIEDLKAGG